MGHFSTSALSADKSESYVTSSISFDVDGLLFSSEKLFSSSILENHNFQDFTGKSLNFKARLLCSTLVRAALLLITNFNYYS